AASESTKPWRRTANADVNGVSLHVAEQGPADGPAVLLLHGFPELWLSWRHQMAALAARGFRALAPDLRGFGDSDAPADPAAYTVLSMSLATSSRSSITFASPRWW
uniref:AB hydrolase-1 domain-containing protein n=1 Tax=Aegilops tauschii subsp. strangulata TaxID=200361 RepID=A0A453MTP4_AEGTS